MSGPGESNARALVHTLDTVVERLERLLRDEQADTKRLGDQLGDAMDEIYNLREQVKVKDQLIVELQAMASQPRRAAR